MALTATQRKLARGSCLKKRAGVRTALRREGERSLSYTEARYAEALEVLEELRYTPLALHAEVPAAGL